MATPDLFALVIFIALLVFSIITLIVGRRPIGAALKTTWRNKSLLSVLLLDFIARTLIIILFVLLNTVVILMLNPELAMQAAQTQAVDPSIFMNSTTIIVTVILFIIELFVILYVTSFFFAGFFGMLKNATQDGSTTFHEFLPSAKRYWGAVFRYLILPSIVLIVAITPFLLVFSKYSEAVMLNPLNSIFNQQLLFLMIGMLLLFAIIASLLVFWLGYGPAVIAFEDAETIPAMKKSFKTANSNISKTLALFACSFAVMFLTMSLVNVVNIGIHTLLGTNQDLGLGTTAPTTGGAWQFISETISFLLNIFFLIAGIMIFAMVFNRYAAITSRAAHSMPTPHSTNTASEKRHHGKMHHAAGAGTTMPVTHIKRKR